MFEVTVETNKNYIFIKMEGFMNDLEMKDAAEKVMLEAQKLKDGYGVITDVSRFKPSSQEGAKEIQKAQRFLLENGANRFIRIVESVLGRMQFSKNAKVLGLEVIEVTNFQEALKHIL